MDFAHTVEELIVQVIGFLILFVILKRVAWRPLLGMLDARRQQIEHDLRQAAQQKEQLVRLQGEYAQRLAKIEDEARVKIQQAILEGKRISTEIQEEARAQSSALVHKAKETIDLELAKAKVTLRDELAAMTLDAVGRILHERLDEEKDKQLVQSVLEELEQKSPQR